MRPVSDAFLRTLRGSHDVVCQAIVCEQFQSGTGPPTGVQIPILGGVVHLDGTADVRSTLDLTTDGTGMWPRVGELTLAPYGNEIYVRRGIRYNDADTEWVGLGYFRIDTPDQDTAPDGPITIAGQDRMAGLVDARLLAPIQFAAGTTLGAIVDQLVAEVYPDATIEWDDSTDLVTLVRPILAEEDRHGFLDDLITAQGKLWYWDHRGVLVVVEPPDPAEPVWDVDAGAGGVLLDLSRHLTRKGVYNIVVGLGEGADTETPARGVAADLNPNSPTYVHGRFGPVPRFYSSPFLATDDQAQRAAAALLRQQLGLPYQVDLSAVANPALEPWDPVRVLYSDRYAPESHVLATLDIPLTVEGAMTAASREQTVLLVGAL